MKTMRAVAIAAAALVTLLAAAAAEADTPPTPPGNLHAASITDTDIVLEWTASTDDSGAVNYAVFFDDNPTPFLTSADTTFDVHLNRAIGMIPGSTHSFRVRAEDPSGNHSFSNTLTASFARRQHAADRSAEPARGERHRGRNRARLGSVHRRVELRLSRVRSAMRGRGGDGHARARTVDLL
jgi:hypothetical protein